MNSERVIRGFYYVIETILVAFGYRREFVDLPEARLEVLHYSNSDADTQMVMIHGIGASAIQFCKILLPLRKKYEVWAVNLPTFINASVVKNGRSYFSADEQTTLLSPWLSELSNKKPLYVVGMSFGAWVALLFSLRHPESVKRVAIINGTGIRRGLEEARDCFARANNDEETTRLLTLIYARWKGFLWFWTPFFKCAWNHPSVQKILNNPDGQKPLDDELSKLKVPVKIIWGEDDQLLRKEVALEFQRLIPGSKLVFISDCGHSPPIERPAECARELLEF